MSVFSTCNIIVRLLFNPTAVMGRHPVKVLEGQLGYAVEPTLSKGHNYLNKIQESINRIKQDFVDVTPKRLAKHDGLHTRCKNLFEEHGARVWMGTRQRLKRSSFTPDYPTALDYASERDRSRYDSHSKF